MDRLITMPVSHYCERARWALDYCGVPYQEERHLQMFHLRPVKRAGGRHSVPVLVTSEGGLFDSADIVAYADARAASPESRLYPEEREARAAIEAIEQGHAQTLGVESRRWAYHRLLRQRRLLLRYNNEGAPLWERAAVRAGFPLLKRTLTRFLRINDETAARAMERITGVFDEVAARLSDGRPFLHGDSFTAADLTFAALAAPALFPPEYGGPFPGLEELRPEVQEETAAFRAHPAGRHALAIYRDHRRTHPSA